MSAELVPSVATRAATGSEARAEVEAAAGVDVDATGATWSGIVFTAEAFRLGLLGLSPTMGDFGVLRGLATWFGVTALATGMAA